MGQTSRNGKAANKVRNTKAKRKISRPRRHDEKVGCTQKASAVLTRCLFLLHTGIALWRVGLLYPSYYLYFLCIGVGFLLIEMVYTIAVRQGKEYKWFCPSVFFYLLSVVPCLWLLELDQLNTHLNTSLLDGGCIIPDFQNVTVPPAPPVTTDVPPNNTETSSVAARLRRSYLQDGELPVHPLGNVLSRVRRQEMGNGVRDNQSAANTTLADKRRNRNGLKKNRKKKRLKKKAKSTSTTTVVAPVLVLSNSTTATTIAEAIVATNITAETSETTLNLLRKTATATNTVTPILSSSTSTQGGVQLARAVSVKTTESNGRNAFANASNVANTTTTTTIGTMKSTQPSTPATLSSTTQSSTSTLSTQTTTMAKRASVATTTMKPSSVTQVPTSSPLTQTTTTNKPNSATTTISKSSTTNLGAPSTQTTTSTKFGTLATSNEATKATSFNPTTTTSTSNGSVQPAANDVAVTSSVVVGESAQRQTETDPTSTILVTSSTTTVADATRTSTTSTHHTTPTASSARTVTSSANDVTVTTTSVRQTSTDHHVGIEKIGDQITEFGSNAIKYIENTSQTLNELLNQLDPQNWLLALHQVLLFVLVIGRWLLPKGEITRDQLSQLLLVFIGVGADILEFVSETIDDDVYAVRCDWLLHVIIYAVWSWSLIQFTLVLTAAKSRKTRVGFEGESHVAMVSNSDNCCARSVFNNADLWGILVTMLLQDIPFLAFRLYMMIVYRQIHQMMVFFTGKNILVVFLQVYRLIVLQVERKDDIVDEATDMELQPLKGTLRRLATQARPDAALPSGEVKNASFKSRNDGTVVVKIHLESESTLKRNRSSTT